MSWVFLFVLGVQTLFLNSWNSKYFGLQYATVVGLAEQHTFALKDQVYPGFNLVEGDETFRFNKQVYPMKQPGQSVVGAGIYSLIKLVGVEPKYHQDYVIHLITWLTSSLMVAGIGWMSFKLARQKKLSEAKASMVAMMSSLGTILLPYAGVMHHDIYAGFMVFASVYLLLKQSRTKLELWLSGVMAGLSLFFSMLPVTIPIVLTLIVISELEKKDWWRFIGGVLVGLLPALSYNYLVFGNPLLFPNLAGKVQDTLPRLSLGNWWSHIKFFLFSPYSITAFSPIVWFGVWGAIKSKATSLNKKIILIIPLVLLIHISTQETFGGFQYGPRYLLPVLPILMLGQIEWLKQKHSKWQMGLWKVAGVYSLLVAVIGAMTTVMFPCPGDFGPWIQLQTILSKDLPSYRMFPIGIAILLGAILVRQRQLPQT